MLLRINSYTNISSKKTLICTLLSQRLQRMTSTISFGVRYFQIYYISTVFTPSHICTRVHEHTFLLFTFNIYTYYAHRHLLITFNICAHDSHTYRSIHLNTYMSHSLFGRIIFYHTYKHTHTHDHLNTYSLHSIFVHISLSLSLSLSLSHTFRRIYKYLFFPFKIICTHIYTHVANSHPRKTKLKHAPTSFIALTHLRSEI